MVSVEWLLISDACLLQAADKQAVSVPCYRMTGEKHSLCFRWVGHTKSRTDNLLRQQVCDRHSAAKASPGGDALQRQPKAGPPPSFRAQQITSLGASNRALSPVSDIPFSLLGSREQEQQLLLKFLPSIYKEVTVAEDRRMLHLLVACGWEAWIILKFSVQSAARPALHCLMAASITGPEYSEYLHSAASSLTKEETSPTKPFLSAHHLQHFSFLLHQTAFYKLTWLLLAIIAPHLQCVLEQQWAHVLCIHSGMISCLLFPKVWDNGNEGSDLQPTLPLVGVYDRVTDS